MDFFVSIITSIVTGVFASVVFYIMLKYIKPRVKVSDTICAEILPSGDVVFTIKIINQSKLTLTQLNYFLQYKTLSPDKINTIQEISPSKTKLRMIRPYSKKDKNYDYAVRITYLIPLDKFPPKENTRLVFTFVAEHPHSSSTTAVTKVYTINDVVFGFFQKGESMEYVCSEYKNHTHFKTYYEEISNRESEVEDTEKEPAKTNA